VSVNIYILTPMPPLGTDFAENIPFSIDFQMFLTYFYKCVISGYTMFYIASFNPAVFS